MFDWIGDFFGELFSLIPKVIYFLYASFISLIDLLQLLFRKLAGLDVYYVDVLLRHIILLLSLMEHVLQHGALLFALSEVYQRL